MSQGTSLGWIFSTDALIVVVDVVVVAVVAPLLVLNHPVPTQLSMKLRFNQREQREQKVGGFTVFPVVKQHYKM